MHPLSVEDMLEEGAQDNRVQELHRYIEAGSGDNSG